MTTFYIRDEQNDVHIIKADSPEKAAETFAGRLENFYDLIQVRISEAIEGPSEKYTIYGELVPTFMAYKH